jgi:adenylate cyclase
MPASAASGSRSRPRLRNRWTRLAISAVVLFVFLLHSLSERLAGPHGDGWFAWGVLTQIERFLYDVRIRQSLLSDQDKRIVIIDIDERSLAAEGQWPWPRDKVARLVEQLFDKYGVRALGFDIVFAEPDKSGVLFRKFAGDLRDGPLAANADARSKIDQELARRDPDGALARAVKERNVVMGYYFKYVLQEGEHQQSGELPLPVLVEGGVDLDSLIRPVGFTGNLPEFQQGASAGGYFDNPLIDRDGSMRRVPLLQYYDGAFYESLSLALTRYALASRQDILRVEPTGKGSGSNYLYIGNARVRIDPQMGVLVPYRGAQGAFPYVSATDVLNGRPAIDELFDTIVLVGTSAPGLLDLRTTPVGHAYNGVEVHANIISALLDGRSIYRPAYDWVIELAMMVLIGLALAWLLPILSPRGGVVLFVMLIAGSLVINLMIWHVAGQVIPMGTPVVYTLAVILLQMTYSFLVESRNKRRLARQFGQYVPRELVEEMDESEQDITLEGSSREMTVLFSDVRGFTKIAEGMNPADLTHLMNSFLTPITSVIHEHRGTVDKYMGDAVMAFWGAPMTDEEHARHGLEAALGMIAALKELQPEFAQRGWPPIEIGIGLNSGTMHVGNMGSEFRMAYTVLGDAVNLGSRIESLTRTYEVDIIVSEYTAALVPNFVFRDLDRVAVKGKERPVTIYEPVGPRDAVPPADAEELSRHNRALGSFRVQAWDEAAAMFTDLRKEFPRRALYRIYLERIEHYRANPPGEGWDGVFRYQVK